MKPKILTILGARPQFVKAAVLSRVIKEYQQIEEVIVHTGQHYDSNMSDVFFEEMQIPRPKYFLNINGLQHGAMTGQMLEKIEQVLSEEKPDAVVVYGDTNSTLAGALAAKKLHIKLIHVEAGLRSFNMAMPEEINRILTDRIADLLVCPTRQAVDNLKLEGFEHFQSKIVQTGDIMKDAVMFYSETSALKSTVCQTLNLRKDKFILATIHRQENTDNEQRLKTIFEALNDLNQSKKVVMPLHPRTKKMMERCGITTAITLIDPVGYFDMLELLKHCSMVVTDSGGLQKEAFFNQKPVLIVREETEWLELVEHGYAMITGADAGKIKDAFDRFAAQHPVYNKNLYGNDVGRMIYKEIVRLIGF
ncbi:MAG: UDP-N-acetylglucosamine 2-epimerase (non-hydrolyzing) [Flavobacteriales bacterium]|nr:MAG: UDP-N-acetylglucosamine 2-epimerase (non-hydrolyzing) [Flavobacteriales bacterium]